MRLYLLIFTAVFLIGLAKANQRMARYFPDYHRGDIYPDRQYDHGYQYGNKYYPPQKYPMFPYPNATFNYYVTWIPVTVNYTNVTLNATNYDYFVGKIKLRS